MRGIGSSSGKFAETRPADSVSQTSLDRRASLKARLAVALTLIFPALPRETMKTFGGILGVLGFIAILGTLMMSTTTTTIYGEQIVNIGLLGSKVLWLVGSCSALILGTTILCAGTILELLGDRTKNRAPDADPPQLTARSDDPQFRESQLDKEAKLNNLRAQWAIERKAKRANKEKR